ncbi:MAG: hypothetical protein ACPGU1_13475 [Myxococcota bacterium]
MLRSTAALLALVFCLTLPGTDAQAGELSVLAGIGPRFDVEGERADAVGVIHVSYEVVPMLLISGEVQGYTGGSGVPDGLALADIQVGALFAAPIPGWFGLEVGASIGLQNLLDMRHNDDAIVGMIKPEIALTASVSLFKARLAYQHNLVPLGTTSALTDTDDGQFTIMAGFVF